MDKKILFICTGNYYRSRFAEIFFNAQAAKLALPWRADSRGIEPSVFNVGPIYPFVITKLEMLGVPMTANPRMPTRLSKTDLESANLVIALNAEEHVPLVKLRFADWVDKIIYWNIPDLNRMVSEEALSRIEKNVTQLLQQLREKQLTENE